MRQAHRQRALERLEDLSHRGLDVVSLWRESTALLSTAIGFDGPPCWFTLDPASLLMTSHYSDGVDALDPEVFRNEYVDDDVNKIADLAVAARPVATLLEATGGQPERSRRYRELMPAAGIEQEIVAALRVDDRCWAAVSLYREPGRPTFDDDDSRFLAAAAPYLAAGARQGLLVAEAREAEVPDPPGLVVVDAAGGLASMTPGTQRWLDAFPDGDAERGRLPSSVLAVAAQAVAARSRRGAAPESVSARVRSRSGAWLMLHGASLMSEIGVGCTAVIIEPAHPARVAPLLMDAYGLSDREQQVVLRVLQGLGTAEIAQELFISPHTVQAHLKNIFEKTGVRSRRQLAAKVFFSMYEPRVRDNEVRTLRRDPVIGGPLQAESRA